MNKLKESISNGAKKCGKDTSRTINDATKGTTSATTSVDAVLEQATGACVYFTHSKRSLQTLNKEQFKEQQEPINLLKRRSMLQIQQFDNKKTLSYT